MPAKVTQDDCDKAEELWGNLKDIPHVIDKLGAIAQAIADERERCAKVAEECGYQCDCGNAYGDCSANAWIASDIRSGGRG